MRNYRRTLGPRFREGTRLLWVALEQANLSVAEAAKKLGWLRATLANVLYGERLPGVDLLSDVKREFGVDLDAWALEPTEPFTPPAGRPTDDEDTGGAETDGAA